MHNLGPGGYEWDKGFFSTKIYVGVGEGKERIVKCFRNPIAKLFAVHVSKTAQYEKIDNKWYAVDNDSLKDLSRDAHLDLKELHFNDIVDSLKSNAFLNRIKFSDISPGGMLSRLTEKLSSNPKIKPEEFNEIRKKYDELLLAKGEGWDPDEKQEKELDNLGKFIESYQVLNQDEKVYSQMYEEKLNFLLELMQELKNENRSPDNWEKETFQSDLKFFENAIKDKKWFPSKEDLKKLDEITNFLGLEKIDWQNLKK